MLTRIARVKRGAGLGFFDITLQVSFRARVPPIVRSRSAHDENEVIEGNHHLATEPSRLYATGYFPSPSKQRTPVPFLVSLADSSNEVYMGHGDSIYSKETFESLGVLPVLCYSIKKTLKYEHPTHIQELAFKAICLGEGRNYVIADQTGTGKTTAYLVPLFQLLMNQYKVMISSKAVGRPKALILVSNRELAYQVLNTANSLSYMTWIRMALLVPGRNIFTQIRVLQRPFDVLITTPRTLIKYILRKRISLDDVSHVVIDEAESSLIYRNDISEEMVSILELLLNEKKKENEKQNGRLAPPSKIIFVGSTITVNLARIIKSVLKDFSLVATENLHKPPYTLQQHWFDVDQDSKPQLLCDIMEKIPNSDQTIIFCNTVASCRYIDNFLSERGYETAIYHREILVRLREHNFKNFQSGLKPILVCTDISSRGIDFSNVKHIVLFDFPQSTIDYINRVGRASRCGKNGIVYNMLLKKDRVLANSIKLALLQQKNLDGLTPDVIKNIDTFIHDENVTDSKPL